MILDRLEEAPRFAGVHPLFGPAFAALAGGGLRSLPPGKHALDGDRLYVVIAEDDGRGKEQAVLEAHRRYIDIQFVLEGADLIGWRPVAECREIRRAYDAPGDAVLFGDAPLSWDSVQGNTFAVYFPSDAHAPLGGGGRLLRAVVKVAV